MRVEKAARSLFQSFWEWGRVEIKSQVNKEKIFYTKEHIQAFALYTWLEILHETGPENQLNKDFFHTSALSSTEFSSGK